MFIALLLCVFLCCELFCCCSELFVGFVVAVVYFSFLLLLFLGVDPEGGGAEVYKGLYRVSCDLLRNVYCV